MIQRIQTIYLMLAALLLISAILAPLVNAHLLSSSEVQQYASNAAIWLPGSVAALLGLIAVFMYKNRALQKRLTKIAMALSILMVLSDGFMVFQSVESGKDIKVSPIILLPLIASVLLWLAIQNIHRDDELVKSMDRFR